VTLMIDFGTKLLLEIEKHYISEENTSTDIGYRTVQIQYLVPGSGKVKSHIMEKVFPFLFFARKKKQHFTF
jgi:hypothetical protein